jgi:hypothetical protein
MTKLGTAPSGQEPDGGAKTEAATIILKSQIEMFPRRRRESAEGDRECQQEKRPAETGLLREGSEHSGKLADQAAQRLYQ